MRLRLRSNLLVVCLLAIAIGCGIARSQTDKEFLPPAPAGKQWKLIWHDEFDGKKLDETKWNRLGDWKRRDGYWVKEDAYLNGKGSLVLRTRKDGNRYTCGAVNTAGQVRACLWLLRCPLQAAEAGGPLARLLADDAGRQHRRQRRPGRHRD